MLEDVLDGGELYYVWTGLIEADSTERTMDAFFSSGSVTISLKV